jgi:hypothetical protein
MECANPKMWIWTCTPEHAFVFAMDDDHSELISRLCTQAGMIMDDAGVIALTIGRVDKNEQAAKLTELREAMITLAKLVLAAQALSS